ncbi:MAG: hypothetical protein Q9221_002483 [Calogaya cf. arnoldii]
MPNLLDLPSEVFSQIAKYAESNQDLEDGYSNESGIADAANDQSDSASEDMESHTPSVAESDDSMEAYYGLDKHHQSQWDYLNCGAMERFIFRLPPNLKYLTLDLSGTDVVPSHGSASEHLYPAVTQCILNVENIRLRLRYIYSSVFGIKDIHSSQQQEGSRSSGQRSASRGGRSRGRSRQARSKGQGGIAGAQNRRQQSRTSINQQPLQFVMHQDPRIAGTSRLKTLVLRLSLSQFLADLLSDRLGLLCTKQCRSFQASRDFGLPKVIALAARHLLALGSGIESLKTSFKDPDPDSLIVYATDCIDWKMLSVSDGQSCLQDDGEGWEDWENSVDLIRVPIPSPTETAQMAVDQNAFRPAGSVMVFDESSSEDDEAEGSAMDGFADAMYPGARAAGLEMGDIMDLIEHDMIFGEDHNPF